MQLLIQAGIKVKQFLVIRDPDTLCIRQVSGKNIAFIENSIRK